VDRVRIAVVVAASVFACAVPAIGRAAATPTTWCGLSAAPAVTNRTPDLVLGSQINVVYAHPAGTPDRLAELASPIASDMAAIDVWWRKQDPTRTPRFDLFDFPGCASTYGKLDLADVTLPQDQSVYFPLDPRFDRIVNTLSVPPFLVSDKTRKYIIYYDAPVSDSSLCGQGGGFNDLFSSGPSWAVIYVQTCDLSLGDGNHAAHVVTHELLHSLGAVPAGAPHECAPPDDGHVCDSPLDILYPFLSATSVFDNEILDVNRDDYYGTGQPIDIRNSPWLIHLDVPSLTLTVATAGRGKGRVTSDVGGIDCPGTCTATEPQGTAMTLTATPDTGSRFVGWSGACSGTDDCVLSFDTAADATAMFAPIQHRVRVAVTRGGRVVSTPGSISCPSRCTGAFDTGSAVGLRAVPAAGYAFRGWSGACSGKRACSLRLTRDVNVRAAFAKT
jgi:hypothetical protein